MSFNYQGKVLRWKEKTGILEYGEVVYCFVQEPHQFRVETRRLVCGVNQLIFPNTSWDKFSVVQ